jgi:DNA-binding IclR family transcriptional regulator
VGVPAADSTATNRTLARVASLLDAAESGPLTAAELARQSGLSVSTAHRLAMAMVDYGFFRRDEAGRFKLGQRFVRTALEKAAAPTIAALRDRTGETVQLWVRRGEERLCALSAEGNGELRVILPVGARLPLPEGSSGRLLASDPAAMEQLQAHGWVESVGLRTEGVGSVSAPVHQEEQLVAAVCLVLPLTRVHESPGRDFGEAVVEAAQRISIDLDHLLA